MSPLQRPHRRRALIVGINYKYKQYQGRDWRRLKFSHKDCDLVKDFIQNAFEYSVSDIRVMKDSSDTPPGLHPTKHNILRWLVEGAMPGDHLFLFYTGHGSCKACIANECSRDPMSPACIIPSDHGWISADTNNPRVADVICTKELREIVLGGLPAGTRLTAIFESCYSGLILGLPYQQAIYPSKAPYLSRYLKADAQVKDKDITGGVICLSACGHHEQTYESPMGSILVKALCEAFGSGQRYKLRLQELFEILQRYYDEASTAMPRDIGPMPNIHIGNSHPLNPDALCDF